MPRTKRLTATAQANMPYKLGDFPNFHKSGSITGMKKIYGKNCLLVRYRAYIYNVTSEPDIYNQHAI